ncbi:30S ribosomal protein S3 [Leuconostoc mesenteroides]|uniref:30S ribosomal protein S3 n=1 Tax=Leuconostoc mesenteroides TaxID=1245 RepID=UPI00065E95B0|nr:30S ribosomal protein S3 [Leuconostoc mesenteroides]AKP36228.1 30S ribosomal protein S3 [Leuconostoc mesenteroides subsp. dextranicum]QUY15449.1 30S ribosomal protein S3 [Leuconostoc mesenteroides]WPK15016.1 30S ribosomal protein S3 [Leuconostoc mesenteroides]GEL82313.1 30S ribosomal protein S3 [Leuconostoc mesenteroides subsp. dextranicum]
MGQKINPTGFRVGVIRHWDAKWFADKADYANQLHEDLRIRKYIEKNLADASVDRIEIERTTKSRVDVSIQTAKPGMVIGKGGSEVEKLRTQLAKLTDTDEKGRSKRVFINIVEIKNPDLSAHLVGQQIAGDLERRVAFRRAMRGAIQRATRSGAKGIKVMVSGRLNGADIARIEQYTEGTVPLHTLRADIDYSWDEAMTAYGNLGIKTWIYRGDVLPQKKNSK